MDKFELLQQKIILNTDDIERFCNIYRFQEKKIVFTNGCFDIIHRGHVEYLAKAASFGDLLIIGLNTDQSVQRIKGKNRPVQDENSRALLLAGFSFVNHVILFNEETPEKLIQTVKPDILVKGSDYSENEIVGASYVKSIGGIVKTIDFVKGFSTTSILEKFCKE